MRAASLFGVFLVAKALVVAAIAPPLSGWAPLAYLWQDGLFVAAFAGVDLALCRWPWAAWGLYAVVVLYVAVNVPVACQLATPMTWPLLRATRPTLADSILYHVTPANLLRLAAVLGTAAGLPLLLARVWHRLPPRLPVTAAVVLLLLAPLGPMATARVETLGLHRNVVVALVATALPRVDAADLREDWRTSPLGSPAAEDLSRFRGRAAGRNVIVIHLESTGTQYLHPYGAAVDPMPGLTELAGRSLLFENTYTAYPETIKSFFAAHCGTFPALDTRPEDYERVPAPSLAQRLSAAGYRTGLFHSGRFCYLGMESVIRDRGWDALEDAGDIGGERDSAFGIDEESTVRRVLAWIDAGPRDRPFFVTYLPIAGHHPYATPGPGPFPMDTEVDRYRNALHYADAALGQLLDGLSQRGLLDHTLLVICGDHGEAFGQHTGNFGHVLFLHEENVHVPLLFAAPGLTEESVRVGRVASLADLSPTVLDLLGLPIPREHQGRSLLDGRSRVALFCTDYSLAFVGLRDGQWKCIHEMESGRTRLFDLAADPEERSDVAAEHPERAEAYREHLRRWAQGQKYRITFTRRQ